jgi:purine-nucleoside phosphorylase
MANENTKGNPLEQMRAWRAETAIVLGSGLNSLVENVSSESIVPYSSFPEIPQPTVPGHAGRFVLGAIEKSPVIFAQGRVHLYEGRSAKEVTAIVRVLAQAQIKQLILTNAAGSANKTFEPGSWMMINDHINLTGTTPLLGQANFVDMTQVYSMQARERFQGAAKAIRLTLHEGVYAGLLGPQYETPAEVRMLRSLGADAIGMSTVLEAIQARALGLEVAGFSCLTNWAAGIGSEMLSHEEVLQTGKSAAESFARLLRAAL